MKTSNKNGKKLIGYSIIGLYVLIIIIIFLTLRPHGPKPIQAPEVNMPTTIPTLSLEEKKTENNIYLLEKYSTTEKDRAVEDFITTLPYNGEGFKVFYYYYESKYMVVIDTNNKEGGDKEFDLFLIKNGVGNRDWFKNLVVRYEPFFKYDYSNNATTSSLIIITPTPAPSPAL